MSDPRVAALDRALEQWSAGDWTAAIEAADPGIEWVTPPEDPDAGVHRGVEGIMAYWAQWAEALEDLRMEAEEYIPAGEQLVVAQRRSGRGRVSGADVEDRLFLVYSFRGERVSRVQEFHEREQALSAAGRGRELDFS